MKRLLFVLVLFVSAGCAQLETLASGTYRERLAAAEYYQGAVYDGALRLDKERRMEVLKVGEEIDKLLDVAHESKFKDLWLPMIEAGQEAVANE